MNYEINIWTRCSNCGILVEIHLMTERCPNCGKYTPIPKKYGIFVELEGGLNN